ncbi:glycosyltransferase family 4 protein [candidate division WOR-3 bacterium]|nr:glycosyltransferase family 4 protein [candidate division WOR-3 bacterium]
MGLKKMDKSLSPWQLIKNKKSKKILLLGVSPKYQGGVATYIRNLLKFPLKGKYRIIFFQTGSSPGEKALKKLIRILTSPMMLGIKIIIENPVIVHINPSLDRKAIWRDSVYLIISKILGRRIVLQIHGGRVHYLNSLNQFLIKNIFNIADKVIILSSIQRKGLIKFISRNKIELVPNPVDTNLYIDKRLSKTDANGLRVVFVSRFIREKGGFEVIRAIPMIIKSVPNVTFIFAGSGEVENEMEKLCEDLDIQKCVKFVGYITGERLIKLYTESDIFVLPTYCKEGFPNVILEAMAAGLPIITTNKGAIPEVIENYKNGFIIPPKRPDIIAKRVITLATDKKLRERIKKNNIRKSREKYDIEIVSKKFIKIYDSILD